jgi:hypothetical protein
MTRWITASEVRLALRLIASAALWSAVALVAAALLITSPYRQDVERAFDEGDELHGGGNVCEGAGLISKVRPSSQKPGGSERAKTSVLRAGELVALTIADEPSVSHVDVQTTRGRSINFRVGFCLTGFEGENRAVDTRGDGGVRPCRNILRNTVADHSESQSATAQTVDHEDDVILDLLESFRQVGVTVKLVRVPGGTISVIARAAVLSG